MISRRKALAPISFYRRQNVNTIVTFMQVFGPLRGLVVSLTAVTAAGFQSLG